MIVTPTSQDLDFLKSDLIRSPGLHASDVYNDFYKQLDPDRYDYEDGGNPLLMACGTAWERFLEDQLVRNGVDATRPGELQSPEGIYYSPDLIIFNGHTRVGEIKWTSMAAFDKKGNSVMPDTETNTLPSKLDKFLTQLKLYAYWLELRHGWLGMLLMHQPWNPQFRAYNLEWSERELVENYRKLMSHATHEGML